MKTSILIGFLFTLFVSWNIGYFFLDPSTFNNYVEYAILSTVWGLGILMIPCFVCFIMFKLGQIVKMTIEK